jgi:tRNA A-37 threonylcarbamoyl transferase component Bud32
VVEGGSGLDRQALSKKICLACDRQFTGQEGSCPMDGTVLVPLKENNFIGSTLADRYLIQSLIGQGGMGLVFLAKHTMMDRTVAIKMLHQELLNDPLSVKRFQQEAKAASCLNHPNIITLHDFGITPQGQPFLCMEYLQGTPLQDLLKRYGPMDPPRAVRIFGQVCDALHHAHNQGIVHRDLKPSNILLVTHECDPEFVKVVDFGLAKLMPWSGKESQHLTKTGEVFGSPIYMSPEQCMGKQLDPRSDIYSLGVTLYEALTGKPPFRGQNSIQTASKHMSELPPTFGAVRPDLTLPPGLEAVVFRSLEKDPGKRYNTMAEMKEAMEKALGAEHLIDEPESLTSSRAGVRAVTPSSIARSTAETTVQKPRPAVNSDAGNVYKPYHIAIAFGVVALLGAGAGMAWMNSQKSATLAPVDTQGTIYYLEKNPERRLHLHSNKGTLLKLTFTQLPNEAGLYPEREQCNGTVVQLTYDPPTEAGELGTITQIKREGGQSQEMDASNVVRGFFSSLANLNEPDTKLLTGGVKIDKAIFNRDNFQSTWLSQNLPSIRDPEFTKALSERKLSPPSNAFKVASIDDKQAVIYADSALIFQNAPTPYWKIELQKVKDDWKISALVPATATEWEAY